MGGQGRRELSLSRRIDPPLSRYAVVQGDDRRCRFRARRFRADSRRSGCDSQRLENLRLMVLRQGAAPARSHTRPPNGGILNGWPGGGADRRSEEHTSELQSLMRISYAVFCLKKKITQKSKHREEK